MTFFYLISDFHTIGENMKFILLFGLTLIQCLTGCEIPWQSYPRIPESAQIGDFVLNGALTENIASKVQNYSG